MPVISLQEFLWQYRSGRNPHARRDLFAGISMAMAIMGKNPVAAGQNQAQNWAGTGFRNGKNL
jgi:hypothetical protein